MCDASNTAMKYETFPGHVNIINHSQSVSQSVRVVFSIDTVRSPSRVATLGWAIVHIINIFANFLHCKYNTAITKI